MICIGDGFRVTVPIDTVNHVDVLASGERIHRGWLPYVFVEGQNSWRDEFIVFLNVDVFFQGDKL